MLIILAKRLAPQYPQGNRAEKQGSVSSRTTTLRALMLDRRICLRHVPDFVVWVAAAIYANGLSVNPLAYSPNEVNPLEVPKRPSTYDATRDTESLAHHNKPSLALDP